MLNRAIFIRPDSELIRESVCACAKLFIDEENVRCAQIKSWKKKKNERIQHENDTKRRIQQALCKNKKKDIIPTYSIFQRVSII
jgi:hypothetical protein